MRPLRPHEYINSVVDEDTSLHSRRLSWETRLHFDNLAYINTHYSQVSRTWAGIAKPPSPQGEVMWAGTGGAFGHSCPSLLCPLRCSGTTWKGSCWSAPRQMPKLPG